MYFYCTGVWVYGQTHVFALFIFIKIWQIIMRTDTQVCTYNLNLLLHQFVERTNISVLFLINGFYPDFYFPPNL